MINDACLGSVNWWGKENIYPASRTRRITVADELLFLLLWSSGCIGFKIALSLWGNFSSMFFRFLIAVLLVGAQVSLQSEWHWPDQRSLRIKFYSISMAYIILKALEFAISAGSRS